MSIIFSNGFAKKTRKNRFDKLIGSWQMEYMDKQDGAADRGASGVLGNFTPAPVPRGAAPRGYQDDAAERGILRYIQQITTSERALS